MKTENGKVKAVDASARTLTLENGSVFKLAAGISSTRQGL